MGDTTGIEWTDATHNFWYGCHKVSQGCKFCYAERQMKRYGKEFRAVTRAKDFDKPCRWKQPRRVFVNSWSDFFIEEADEWRDEAWSVIRETPHLTYQILTKRPERIADHLPEDWGDGYVNVWLGVSVESGEVVHRLTDLIQIPAAVRFVSVEPLLGLLDLSAWLMHGGLDWVIVGGESGPQARPMDEEWLRWIVEDCRIYNIPLFFKQWGGWPDKRGGDRAVINGRTYQQFPDTPATGQLSMF